MEDAQKIADEYPYTFYKPSKQVISQLQVGNQVKLIFEFQSDDPKAPRAERTWVKITSFDGERFCGQLRNHPAQIKDLCYGDSIVFSDCHIVDTDLDYPVPSITEKYIKRCFATNNILPGYPSNRSKRSQALHLTRVPPWAVCGRTIETRWVPSSLRWHGWHYTRSMDGDEIVVAYRFVSDGELKHPEEQHSTASGMTTVEAEHEFVQVADQVYPVHSALMRTQQPPFNQ